MRRRLLALVGTIAAIGASGLVAAPSAQAASICSASSSICLTDLQLSARSVDLTRMPGTPVTVKLRLTSPVDLNASNGFYLYATATTRTVADTGSGGFLSIPIQNVTLTSGTARDGWWSGTFALTPGTATTWQVSGMIANPAGTGYVDVSAQSTAAAGLPSTITSTVTAIPGTPTGLKVVSEWYPDRGVVAVAYWSQMASGAVAASGWQVVTSGSCGSATWTLSGVLLGTSPSFKTTRVSAGTCKMTVRAINDKGISTGSVSGSAFIF